MARASDHRPLPPLPWLRAFEATARHESFTEAANELALTQAAISQQVRKLEGWLGTPLFHRHARSIELTEHGAAYLPHVQAAFAGLSRSTGELFGRSALSTVTLRCPVSFATLWLAPRLADFTASVPQVRLATSTIQMPSDYEREEADLEIRFGSGDWPGRKAHRITVETLTPMCAPGLYDPDRDSEEFGWTGLPLLSLAGPREMWSAWFALAGIPPPSKPAHRFDTFVTALAAAQAGAGVLLGSRPLVDAAVAAGNLRRLSRLELQAAGAHYLVYGANVVRPPAVEETVEWILNQAVPL